MSTAKKTAIDFDFDRKYQLLARIGSGGMGDVFLGAQRGAEDFSRLVVVKRIHDREVPAKFAEANSKMFLNEARVIASLNHPHIVKVFDFLMAGSSFCIVMEYVEGETLRYIFSECEKQKIKFPAGLACSIIYDACNTLNYAHNATSASGKLRNIIHRDIGLHNLMLDSSGYLKIIDFGIAKSSIHTDMTSPGLIKGNPSYMAPELFANKPQDHRLDIYALGLCLYELLTQTRAFLFSSSATVGEVIEEITQRELPPPSSFAADLPEGIDEIVSKAIAKDRDERYQTTEAFGQDLKRVAGNIFMTGSESQKWFTEYFGDRLQERREFGAKILAFAARSDADSEMEISLPSNFPSGFEIVNDITPLAIEKTPMPYPGDSWMWRLVSANPVKIAAGVLLVGLLVAVGVYFPLFRGVPQKSEDVGVVDNLKISCKQEGARLRIDGKDMGKIGAEPLHFYVEPKKKHEIVISKDGYRDFTFPFIGPPKGIKRIDAELTKIVSEPPLKKEEEPPPSAVSNATESEPVTKPEAPPPKKEQLTGSVKKKGKKKAKSFQLKKGKKKAEQPSSEETVPKRKIPLPDDDELMRQ